MPKSAQQIQLPLQPRRKSLLHPPFSAQSMTRPGSFFHGIAFTAVLLFAACAEPGAPVEAETLPPATAPEAWVPAEASAQQPTTATPSTAQLNPAHGEPGHDCAIPVGAPLDGSGNAGTSDMVPLTTPSAAPMPSAMPVPSGNTGNLNPAHGEPGHDCAVPVGSPLPG